MKPKISILILTKSFFILLISCCLFSCNGIKRNYTVQLSNFIGSSDYECDSVIWISDSHFKLKNKENDEPFMDIIVPKDILVKIFLNIN